MTRSAVTPASTEANDNQRLRAIAAPFEKSSVAKAVWQMVNTLGPFALIWVAMYFTRNFSWWLTIPLAMLNGLFLVRIFIIFHDCGHGSFFVSKKANTVVGFVTGLLTFTPYHHWRWEHSVHHASSGNLDARGIGDIWTMTVNEYLAASTGRKLCYRLARNPLILFGLGPIFLFAVLHRVPARTAKPRERREVHLMTMAVILMGIGMSQVFGWRDYLILQAVVLMVGGCAGLWMFYVQHQFEDVYWEKDAQWNHNRAALEGSSYYQLPSILQWFSGNIGFHHIHHLNSRIPNYNLERAYFACPEFQNVQPITLWSSLKTIRLRLWDSRTRRMIGYRELRQYQLA